MEYVDNKNVIKGKNYIYIMIKQLRHINISSGPSHPR